MNERFYNEGFQFEDGFGYLKLILCEDEDGWGWTLLDVRASSLCYGKKFFLGGGKSEITIELKVTKFVCPFVALFIFYNPKEILKYADSLYL